jgi:hypothetical protein
MIRRFEQSLADSCSIEAMIFYTSQCAQTIISLDGLWHGEKTGADFIFKRIHGKKHRVGCVGNTLNKQAV